MADALEKAKARYIAPIDEAELAVRICEAQNGLKRPPGSTARQALDGMEPKSRNAYRNAARAAMTYWKECIDGANRPSGGSHTMATSAAKAVLVGSWPTKGYGTFEERLKVQKACVDMAAAVRAGKDRAGHSDGEDTR
jgi:hypothetical protein